MDRERIRLRCSALDIFTAAELESLAGGPFEEADALVHLLVECRVYNLDVEQQRLTEYLDDECLRLINAWETHPARATEPAGEHPPRYPSESISVQHLEELAHAPRQQQSPAFKQLEITVKKLMLWHAHKRTDALVDTLAEFFNKLFARKGVQDLPAVPSVPYNLGELVQMALSYEPPHTSSPPGSSSTASSTTGSLPQHDTPSPPGCTGSPPQHDTPSPPGSSSTASSTTGSPPPHHTTSPPGSTGSPPQHHAPTRRPSGELSSALQHPHPAPQGCGLEASSPAGPAAGAWAGAGAALTLQERVRLRCSNLAILSQADVEALAAGSFEEAEAVLQLLVEAKCGTEHGLGLHEYLEFECARLADACGSYSRLPELRRTQRNVRPPSPLPHYPSESISLQQLEELRDAEASTPGALNQLNYALNKLHYWHADQREAALAEKYFGFYNLPLLPRIQHPADR